LIELIDVSIVPFYAIKGNVSATQNRISSSRFVQDNSTNETNMQNLSTEYQSVRQSFSTRLTRDLPFVEKCRAYKTQHGVGGFAIKETECAHFIVKKAIDSNDVWCYTVYGRIRHVFFK